jgi:hypothetical protein
VGRPADRCAAGNLEVRRINDAAAFATWERVAVEATRHVAAGGDMAIGEGG